MVNKIIIKIRGGLGNQLFQYAYAKKMASVNNDVKIILDVSYYNKQRLRKLDIANYNFYKVTEKINHGLWLIDFLYTFYRIIYRYCPRVLSMSYELFLSNFNVFFCDYNITEPILRNRSSVYLCGYFQVERYIRSILPDLSKDLRIDDQLSTQQMKMLNLIKNSRNSVAIVIRLGADLQKARIPYCKKEYYIEGLLIIKRMVENPDIYIFSDCVDTLLRERWFDGDNITYVKGYSPVEGLCLLKSCDNFIISNSTFAWWGAYLGNNQRKIIIGPEFFLKDVRMSASSLHIPGAIYLNMINGDQV